MTKHQFSNQDSFPVSGSVEAFSLVSDRPVQQVRVVGMPYREANSGEGAGGVRGHRREHHCGWAIGLSSVWDMLGDLHWHECKMSQSA